MSEPSSLQRYDRLADRIRQHRQAVAGPVLVVEGVRDKLILAPLLAAVSIFPATNKNEALAGAMQLTEWTFARWGCIIDRDFDPEIDRVVTNHRIHPYEGADLEAMLISLGVLNDLLVQIGSEEKIAREGGIERVVIRLCQAVEPVAALREANARERWGLPFDGIPLEGKIDRRTLLVNVRGLCTALLRDHPAVGLAALVAIAEDGPQGPCRYRGKDVVTVAGVALRAKIGTLRGGDTTEHVLSGALRSSGIWRLSQSEWLEELRQIVSDGNPDLWLSEQSA